MITLRYYLWVLIVLAVFVSVVYNGLKGIWYGPATVNKKAPVPLPALKVLQVQAAPAYKPFNGSASTYVR